MGLSVCKKFSKQPSISSASSQTLMLQKIHAVAGWNTLEKQLSETRKGQKSEVISFFPDFLCAMDFKKFLAHVLVPVLN